MIKHGHRKQRTPTYHSWNAMKQRCTNSNREDFQHYGGRGISFDLEWDFFSNFLRDMGERPSGTTLDRIDVNGNYCKANCRWATPAIQANNRRKLANGKELLITYQNEYLPIDYINDLIAKKEGRLARQENGLPIWCLALFEVGALYE